jgi:hypothetical protein
LTLRSEEEVLEMIEDMKKRSKGKYITQGVSFNKTCPRQMELLKKALMASASFSGLAKEMLALRFDENSASKFSYGAQGHGYGEKHVEPELPKTKNYGNFI